MGQNLDDCEMNMKIAKETYKQIMDDQERMASALMNAWAKAGI